MLFNLRDSLEPHFGARAKYTWNAKYNLTGYFVNGFNNVVDNNSGKTYGVSFGWNPTPKNAVTLNYFAGPEEPTGAYGFTSPAETDSRQCHIWRQTIDVVFMYNLTPKLTFMGNYDYVHGDRLVFDDSLTKPVYYTGGAGYLKYAPSTTRIHVAARYEYFYDRNGFARRLQPLLWRVLYRTSTSTSSPQRINELSQPTC